MKHVLKWFAGILAAIIAGIVVHYYTISSSESSGDVTHGLGATPDLLNGNVRETEAQPKLVKRGPAKFGNNPSESRSLSCPTGSSLSSCVVDYVNNGGLVGDCPKIETDSKCSVQDSYSVDNGHKCVMTIKCTYL